MDRITRVAISGFRAIQHLELKTDGLVVLIGENGTGKSSIVEAIEVLAKAARPGGFVNDWLAPFHGNFRDLLRVGSAEMKLAVHLEGDEAPIDYSFTLAPVSGGTRATVIRESLKVYVKGPGVGPLYAIQRDAKSSKVFDVNTRTLVDASPGPEQLLLTYYGSGSHVQPAIGRVLAALAGTRVHVPFDLRPLWVSQEEQRRSALRVPAQVEPAKRLERLGVNLANCFMELGNRGPEVRDAVLEDVRAGLGLEVVEVSTPSTARGFIDLAVRFKGLAMPIYSAGLSDGQLTYLAFVALRHLDESSHLLAIDEPEIHLHPALLARCTWLFESLSKKYPVILSTHADTILDVVSDPAAQVRVCSLDKDRATRLDFLDPKALAHWRQKFSGLGDIRRAGLTHLLLGKPEGA